MVKIEMEVELGSDRKWAQWNLEQMDVRSNIKM